MKNLLLGFWLSISFLNAADKQWKLEGFPNGDRLCGAELLDALQNGKDVEKILKKCNMQDAYIGAFNEILDITPGGNSIQGIDRNKLFRLAEDFGKKEQKKLWEWKTVAIAATGSFVGMFVGGFFYGQSLQSRAARVPLPPRSNGQ